MPAIGPRGARRDAPWYPTPTAGTRRPGRRDRRGRGIRGSLAPAEVPLARTEAERFDDVATAAVARLDKRWARELAEVQFVVEDVPDLADWDRDWVPLGRSDPAEAGLAARVVLYRRPIQTRARGEIALRRLVLDVVVEQVADVLGMDPKDVDSGYSEPG
jgi:predicted Zn-dependent protease with MMP-like domain